MNEIINKFLLAGDKFMPDLCQLVTLFLKNTVHVVLS